VFVNKEVKANPNLFHLGGALYSQGFGFGGGQRGKQEGGQNGNNSDDDQEFNQGERGTSRNRSGMFRFPFTDY
jgi:hypothetical protein